MGRLRPTLILGGPGCGKTTALLKIVEEAFARGVQPERIAFVAFTRKAAQEARDRMVEKFGVEKESIPYFRTLHSFAFAHIDIQASQILTGDKLRAYAKAEGLDLTPDYVDEFGQIISQPQTPDEQALNAMSLARLTLRDLEDVVAENDLSLERVLEIKADYEEFKQDAILYDFTDMLEKFVANATLPEFDLLIVDEAQDLSKLQWLMVEKLVDQSKDVYFAGDDDQAIYSWAGADIEYFLSMKADREVLPVSYRLKSNVFDACQKVIGFCGDRYAKDWKPHSEGGEIDFVSSLNSLDLSQGTWFFLARTNSLIRSFTKFMHEEGYPYFTPGPHGMQSSVAVDPVQAVLTYENLRMGKTFPGEKLDLVWSFIEPSLRPSTAPVFEPLTEYGLNDLCSTGFVADRSWLEALRISGAMQNYIRLLRSRGESLVKPPRITVSTIHGVKGGEADNVVVWQKLSSRTYGSWMKADPQEVRALFTAMSRAKERLIFLDSKSSTNYGIERLLT